MTGHKEQLLPQGEVVTGPVESRLTHYANRLLSWCCDDKATRTTLGEIVSDMLREAKSNGE